MFKLENASIICEISTDGKLQSLRNAVSGREYAGGGGLWRIIYQHGVVLEEELRADDATVRITKAGENELCLEYTHLYSTVGPVNFKVAIRARLDGAELALEAELFNHDSQGVILREFQFPLLANLQLTPATEWINFDAGGQRHPNVIETVRKGHTVYLGMDNKAIESSVLYPGLCAMNYYVLSEPENQLYVASCDPEFRSTLHLLRLRGNELDALLVKYPFLAPGESTTITGYRVAPVAGSWHRAADLYRAWLDTWMLRPVAPDSIQNSNGWHRLIMRHQYGKVLFRYDELPRILQSGLECGIDTLFMFGWHAGGHDAEYPNYRFDEESGGHDELKRQIASFQVNGGKVILYFNGQLIDTGTPYYQTCGKHISVKLPSGREHMEVYQFGGDGTALRQFGNKVFVTACPACQEWHEILKSLIDQAAELGCAGVFFDQLGYLSRPCCDPSHGHRVPFTDVFKTKAAMVRDLYNYVKTKYPAMSLGIEWINDVTAQHVDYVHNITGGCFGDAYLEAMRYTMPEIITTDREIRDDTEIKWRVNHAVRLGLRSDVEIYRCRALIDETPLYKSYIKEANHFRDKHRDIILKGRFRDTLGVTCSAAEVEYSVYETTEYYGIVLTRRGNATSPLTASVEWSSGGILESSDALGKATIHATAANRAEFTLDADALLLLKLRR